MFLEIKESLRFQWAQAPIVNYPEPEEPLIKKEKINKIAKQF
jgi:hypothetical protein